MGTILDTFHINNINPRKFTLTSQGTHDSDKLPSRIWIIEGNTLRNLGATGSEQNYSTHRVEGITRYSLKDEAEYQIYIV